MPTNTPSLLPISLPVSNACLVADGDYLVIDLCVEHIGHEACADALYLVRARNTCREHCRGLRLNRNDLYAGLLVFQILADARDGAAGADACDEDIDLAVGVFKDLGTRGLIVRLAGSRG